MNVTTALRAGEGDHGCTIDPNGGTCAP